MGKGQSRLFPQGWRLCCLKFQRVAVCLGLTFYTAFDFIVEGVRV
jgi:hypothetical protein